MATILATANETITDITDAVSVNVSPTSIDVSTPATLTLDSARDSSVTINIQQGPNNLNNNITSIKLNSKNIGNSATSFMTLDSDGSVATFNKDNPTKNLRAKHSGDTEHVGNVVTITMNGSQTYSADGYSVPMEIAFKDSSGQTISFASTLKINILSSSATITSTTTYYCIRTDTSVPADDYAGWNTTYPTATAPYYLWTKQVVSYNVGNPTSTKWSSYIAKNGTNGSNSTSTYKTTKYSYQVSNSNSTTPTGTWQELSKVTLIPGQYLWTKINTIFTVKNGSSSQDVTSTAYSSSPIGEAMYSLDIIPTSTNGTIIKNNTGSVTLKAQLTASYNNVVKTIAIASAGTCTLPNGGSATVRWYKIDNGANKNITSAGATTTNATYAGASITITAANVNSSANFIAHLEQ